MAFVKTTWVDDSGPDLTAAQLNRMEQGIADAHSGKASVPVVAALPTADLVDGMTVRLLPSTSLNVTWLMAYTATYPGDVANPGSSKWHYLGGAPWWTEWLNEAGTPNTGGGMEVVAGITAMTVPQTGTYDVEFQVSAAALAATAIDLYVAVRKNGVTQIGSSYLAWARFTAANHKASPVSKTRVALAKNDLLTLWWQTGVVANSVNIYAANLSLLPVRLAQ